MTEVDAVIVEVMLPKIYADLDALLAVLPKDFKRAEVMKVRGWLPAKYSQSFQQVSK